MSFHPALTVAAIELTKKQVAIVVYFAALERPQILDGYRGVLGHAQPFE